MSSLARRSTSVISASMDMGTGEEPGGWPGAGLREESGNRDLEERRVICRLSDSFMASLSRSLVLKKKKKGKNSENPPFSSYELNLRLVPEFFNFSDVVLYQSPDLLVALTYKSK